MRFREVRKERFSQSTLPTPRVHFNILVLLRESYNLQTFLTALLPLAEL